MTTATESTESLEEHIEEVLNTVEVARPVDIRTKAVVVGSPVGIRENLVGLTDLFESCFGLGVAGIGVRVILACESAIGLLQVV